MTFTLIRKLLDNSRPDSLNLDAVQTSPSNQKKTCVYYANWTIYSRKHNPDKIPLNDVTNIFYSFFNIDKDTGKVTASDSWADIEQEYKSDNRKVNGLFAKFFELKRSHRGLKVSMSIGGWSNRETFKEGVNTNSKLENFVKTSIENLVEYGFDGIDLDWEYPENKKEAKQYLTIIEKLRTGLRNLEQAKGLPHDSFLLTIASPAFSEKLDLFDIQEMDKYLSFWNLMTYDFAGEWSEKTGYHANLFKTSSDELCAADAVEYFLKKGVNPQKLILGMANYGRSFANTSGIRKSFRGTGPNSQGESQGIWSYFELPPEGYQEGYDSKAVAAFAFNAEKHHLITYDNVQSIKEKAQYVVRKNLGGGMWWESSGDNYKDKSKSLLRTFVSAIGDDNLDRSENHITGYEDSHYLRNQGLI